MLTVACVLRSGGIYDAAWVARLQSGVVRHLPIEHRFVCLSDVEVPCDRIPLKHKWPGWWSKIEALCLPGPVLALDLDTAIVGDLSDIARVATANPMTVLQDFYRLDGIGSGVVAWNGSMSILYETFLADPDGWMRNLGGRGDQGFLEEAGFADDYARWQFKVPGQIVSYKVHCRNGIPPNARIVCLHGRPKFLDMPENDAVRQAWELAA